MSAEWAPGGDPAIRFDYLDRQPQNYVIPTPGWGIGRCWKCGQLIGSHQYHACPADQTFPLPGTYPAPWNPGLPSIIVQPYVPPTTTTTITVRAKKARPDGEAMRADEV